MVKEVARKEVPTQDLSWDHERIRIADGVLHSLSLTLGLALSVISGVGVNSGHPASLLFRVSAAGLGAGLSILTVCNLRPSGIFPKTKL